METKTITCHNVYNYGAALQAYALQTFLTESGYENEIVDYNPWYLYDRYQFFNVGNPRWKKNILTKAAYIALKLPQKIDFLKRKKKFDTFNEQYFHLTDTRYFNHEQLTACGTDVLICGSDQIWNTMFENGSDGAFFGEYIAKKKLISYAASLGTDCIPAQKEDWFRQELSKFDALSVREQSAQKEVERLGFSGARLVTDPVYLLPKESWVKRFSIEQQTKEKYLLTYFFEGNAHVRNICEYAAKQIGLKIYSINSTKCDFADKSFHHSGPKEFLELVYGAEMVLTNSFHGLSFSIIFEKNFWALKRDSLNTRIADMLTSIGLEGRQIGEADLQTTDFSAAIDYEKPRQLLAQRMSTSKAFLLDFLEEINDAD